MKPGIEKHQILVSLCSAFFSPLLVTLCLFIFPERWEADDESDGSVLVYESCMIITQLIQTILIHYLSFMPYNFENQDHKSCINKCMPKLNYSISILLFLILPVFNILVYIMMLTSEV